MATPGSKEQFWSGFAEGLARYSSQQGAEIMQQEAEKRAETRQVEAETRAEERAGRLLEKEKQVGLEYFKKENDYRTQATKDLTQWTAQFNADLQNSFSNPRIAQTLDAWVGSGDPMLMQQADAVTQGMQDVMTNKEVDPEIFRALGEDASPILQILGEKKQARDTFNKQLVESASRSNMYNAMSKQYEAQAELLGKQIEGEKAISPEKFTKAYTDLLEMSSKVLESPSFRHLQELASKNKIKEGSPEAQAYQAYIHIYQSGKDMAESLQRQYLKASGVPVDELEKVMQEKLLELEERERKIIGEQKRKGVEELMKQEDMTRKILAPTEEESKEAKERIKGYRKWLKDLLTKGKADVPEEKKEDFIAFVQEILSKSMEGMA